MKTKKAKVIIPMVIITVGIICVCLFIGNKNSIIGEWKIDSFVVEDEMNICSYFYKQIGNLFNYNFTQKICKRDIILMQLRFDLMNISAFYLIPT